MYPYIKFIIYYELYKNKFVKVQILLKIVLNVIEHQKMKCKIVVIIKVSFRLI